MTQYVATINTPGYLPQDDDPPEFYTARGAWAFLADEREAVEESMGRRGSLLSDTWEILNTLGSVDANGGYLTRAAFLAANGLAPDGTGTVHGPTPGYQDDRDLGVAYSVIKKEG